MSHRRPHVFGDISRRGAIILCLVILAFSTYRAENYILGSAEMTKFGVQVEGRVVDMREPTFAEEATRGRNQVIQIEFEDEAGVSQAVDHTVSYRHRQDYQPGTRLDIWYVPHNPARFAVGNLEAHQRKWFLGSLIFGMIALFFGGLALWSWLAYTDETFPPYNLLFWNSRLG